MKIESVTKTNEESKKETIDRIEHQDPAYGDIFTVAGLPEGMEGFWGNTRKDMLETHKWRDKWEVVNSNNAPHAKTVCKQPDGTHTMGDAILMMRPKSIGEEEQRKRHELAKLRSKRTKAEFKEMAERMGVKTIDDHK